MTEKKKEVKKTPKKVVKEEKFTLLELVQESQKPFYLIKSALIANDLFGKYVDDKAKTVNGEKVVKSLTKKEFNKIINEFIKREI